MIEPECIEELSVPLIRVGPEKGRQAVVRNPQGLQHSRIRVDGCMVCEGPRADWVVERDQAAVVIELKGRNVEHGADQAACTAERWKVTEHRVDRVAALIVGRQVPAASTTIQIKKERFARRFGGPLHVVNRNCEYEWEHLLSFRGPFKS